MRDGAVFRHTDRLGAPGAACETGRVARLFMGPHQWCRQLLVVRREAVTAAVGSRFEIADGRRRPPLPRRQFAEVPWSIPPPHRGGIDPRWYAIAVTAAPRPRLPAPMTAPIEAEDDGAAVHGQPRSVPVETSMLAFS